MTPRDPLRLQVTRERLANELIFAGLSVPCALAWMVLGSEAILAGASGPLWTFAGVGATLLIIRPARLRSRPIVLRSIALFTALNIFLVGVELFATVAAAHGGEAAA